MEGEGGRGEEVEGRGAQGNEGKGPGRGPEAATSSELSTSFVLSETDLFQMLKKKREVQKAQMVDVDGVSTGTCGFQYPELTCILIVIAKCRGICRGVCRGRAIKEEGVLFKLS